VHLGGVFAKVVGSREDLARPADRAEQRDLRQRTPRAAAQHFRIELSQARHGGDQCVSEIIRVLIERNMPGDVDDLIALDKAVAARVPAQIHDAFSVLSRDSCAIDSAAISAVQ
jgi:hypothetical protein